MDLNVAQPSVYHVLSLKKNFKYQKLAYYCGVKYCQVKQSI